jgi:hypothetical protein
MPMPAEPRPDAAIDVLRTAADYLDTLDGPPTSPGMSTTVDFTFEDRRSGGVNFGEIDASRWLSFVSS